MAKNILVVAAKTSLQRLEAIDAMLIASALGSENDKRRRMLFSDISEALDDAVRDVIDSRPDNWKQPDPLTPLDCATIKCAAAAECLRRDTHSRKLRMWLSDVASMPAD